MRNCVVLIVGILAVASLPTLASAGDAKQQNAAPATAAAQLSDQEMGQITAGHRPDWAGHGRPYFAGGKPDFAGHGRPSWAGKPL
jgi:type II secretory pathway pseudopilin PulG